MVPAVGEGGGVGVLAVEGQAGGGLLEGVVVVGVAVLALERLAHGVADLGLEEGEPETELRRFTGSAMGRGGLDRGGRGGGEGEQQTEGGERGQSASGEHSPARPGAGGRR